MQNFENFLFGMSSYRIDSISRARICIVDGLYSQDSQLESQLVTCRLNQCSLSSIYVTVGVARNGI